MSTVQMVLEAYDKNYLPVVISASRIRSSIKHLNRLLGAIEVRSLDEQLLVAYREKRKAEDAASGTINREIGSLSSALGRSGVVLAIKFPYEREIPRAARLTEQQIQKLINYAPNLQTKAFIALLLATGQRKEAVLNLKYSQIRDNVIEFGADGYHKAYRRKSRARTPVSGPIKGILEKLRAAFGKTEYVIPAGVGKDKPCSNMARWFKYAAEMAGIEASAHVIRHSAASILIEKGYDLMVVSKFLGHQSVQTTERVYVKTLPSYTAAATNQLGESVSI